MKPVLFAVCLALIAAACTPNSSDEQNLTVYSGRSEELIGPLIEQFEEESGIEVSVRYGDSAELAATILEEGDRSPASVFLAQDPASLGSVALAGLFSSLPEDLLDQVPATYSDRDGLWIGVSGRARSVVYDPTATTPDDLPPTEDGLTDADWAGRVGIAPTNGSFLSFVAAKILLDGEAATLSWLEGMKANESPTFPKNSTIVSAVADGQVETGLVNHYYALRLLAEDPTASVANCLLPGGVRRFPRYAIRCGNPDRRRCSCGGGGVHRLPAVGGGTGVLRPGDVRVSARPGRRAIG